MTEYYNYENDDLKEINEKLKEYSKNAADIRKELIVVSDAKSKAIEEDNKPVFKEANIKNTDLKDELEFENERIRIIKEDRSRLASSISGAIDKEVQNAHAKYKEDYAVKAGEVKKLRDAHAAAVSEIGRMERIARNQILSGHRQARNAAGITEYSRVQEYGVTLDRTMIVYPDGYGYKASDGLSFSKEYLTQKYDGR